MAVYSGSRRSWVRVAASTGRPDSSKREVASRPKTVVKRGVTILVATGPRLIVYETL